MKILDRKLIKFILVGFLNTILSAIIMFLLYNKASWGYWGASSVAYIMGSIISFILNKTYTFKNNQPILITGIKFAINIIICYLLAYSIAKPFIRYALYHYQLNVNVIEQISMFFGMLIFTALNYIGQRFYAFNTPIK